MAGSRIKEYPDWQAAAEASRSRKAISRDLFYGTGYDKEHRKSVVRELLIVKPEFGDPWFVHKTSPGIPFAGGKCKAADVKSVKVWKSY